MVKGKRFRQTIKVMPDSNYILRWCLLPPTVPLRDKRALKRVLNAEQARLPLELNAFAFVLVVKRKRVGETH